MSTLIGRAESRPVIEAGVQTRAAFITRTYVHLLGAIAGFTCLEIVLFRSGVAERFVPSMVKSWFVFAALFMIVGWLASRTAHMAASKGVQYVALAGFVVAEAVVFMPLLYVAQRHAPAGTIESAAMVTLAGFAVLTAIVFTTRKDFSFLRGVLIWGFVCAGLAVLASFLFGWNLGPAFSVAMIALAGAAVLYDTSNVLHHFPEDRYVGASLELFASVAVMFWYVLRLFISSRD